MRQAIDQTLLLLTVLPFWLAVGAPAAEVPLGVSPGETARSLEIGDRCPTFSWTAVDSANGYELVVYRLAEDDRTPEPVLRKRFEGPANGWTPPLGHCLEAGRSYVWSVRVTHGADARNWSPPLRFRVVEARSPSTLAEALEVVRAYQEALRVEASDLPASASIKTLAALDGSSGSDSTHALAPGGAVEVSIAGGVDASFFAGDGSALTGLDPTKISAGIADISVTGSSRGVTCFGCISWPHFAAGEITSGQVQNYQVTSSDIDPSTVQARIGSCDDDSVIQSIDSSGTVTCSANTQVLSGQEYSVESSGGGIESVSVARANRHCFLSRVGFQRTWLQNSACKIELSQYGGFWVLFASSQGDSVAKCRMRCIEIVPNRTD